MTNKSIDELAAIRNEKIGFVFQSFNLIDELTVSENIELPLLYMGISTAERKQKVNETMERMQITHREKHFPQQLSGGQQQRVAIARALINDPTIIMGDEPTGNLDSKNTKNVFRIFRELSREQGQTIITVTHDNDFASNCDRVIELKDGQIVNQ